MPRILAAAALTLLVSLAPARALNVAAANYPAYDLARHVVGGTGNVTLLLRPGSEAHSYEPGYRDLRALAQADLFVATGGENERWLERLAAAGGGAPERFSMLEWVEPLEGGDEHVWTSLRNDIVLLEALAARLSELDPGNAGIYRRNARDYAERFAALDERFSALVSSSARRLVIVADRFPFAYFARDYGLEYAAAVPGCSEQTEASSRSVARLIDLVREQRITTILRLEMSDAKLAGAVARETGAEVATLNSCHNISVEQFTGQVEMVTLLEHNLRALRRALN